MRRKRLWPCLFALIITYIIGVFSFKKILKCNDRKNQQYSSFCGILVFLLRIQLQSETNWVCPPSSSIQKTQPYPLFVAPLITEISKEKITSRREVGFRDAGRNHYPGCVFLGPFPSPRVGVLLKLFHRRYVTACKMQKSFSPSSVCEV